MVTKSGVMLGLGESEPELFQAMDDLREVGCEVLTLWASISGRRPNHLPVVSYVTPAAIRSLRRYRAPQRVRSRRLGSACPQLLSRGGFSSGGSLTMESGAPQPGRPLDRRNVAAVIPAYHEEVHVGKVAERARVQLDHVLVVDDGSTDRTAERARAKVARKSSSIRQNRGKGEVDKDRACDTGWRCRR